MSQYNPHTIRRDLALLTEERLYTVEIKVSAGGARVSMVDVADFIPPIEVLDVWNSLSTKTKLPQIRLFESLETAVKTLAEYLVANNYQWVSNEEADASRRARIYQDQPIRSAIEEKVTEVRVQVLSVL